MNANKDFIIVHTTTEKATIHGKKIKRSKSETWLLKKYLGNDESVTVPAFITNIGYCAFEGCDNLKKISTYTFFECHEKLTIYGISKSEAENFAHRKGYKFVSIGK